MGHVVAFTELKAQMADGVSRASIRTDDHGEFAADYLRIEAGRRWNAVVPQGCDYYLFVTNGTGTVAGGDARQGLASHSFATIEEGVAFTVENDQSIPLELVGVTAPPQAHRRGLPGFTGGIAVAERGKVPVVPIPDQHKKRIYFVGGTHGVKSERGHAMIVVYDGQTNTPMHHHPDADSMFVVLDGAVRFTVNGEQIVVTPGQAAVFPSMDRHALQTADGHEGASFLEFHIPAAFTTVKA